MLLRTQMRFFIVGGICCLLLSGYFYVQESASLSWPFTHGNITESFMKIDHSSRGRSSFRPVVVYAYVVNQKKYASSNRGYGIVAGPQYWASEIVAKYPVGGDVIVFYDSNNPSDAILEVGRGWAWPMTAAAGLLLIIPAIFAHYFLFKKNDKKVINKKRKMR